MSPTGPKSLVSGLPISEVSTPQMPCPPLPRVSSRYAESSVQRDQVGITIALEVGDRIGGDEAVLVIVPVGPWEQRAIGLARIHSQRTAAAEGDYIAASVAVEVTRQRERTASAKAGIDRSGETTEAIAEIDRRRNADARGNARDEDVIGAIAIEVTRLQREWIEPKPERNGDNHGRRGSSWVRGKLHVVGVAEV